MQCNKSKCPGDKGDDWCSCDLPTLLSETRHYYTYPARTIPPTAALYILLVRDMGGDQGGGGGEAEGDGGGEMSRVKLEMFRVLVCGGRGFQNYTLLNETLSKLDEERSIDVLIHGGALGADTMADDWARAHDVNVMRFPADWSKHGRAAGPIRNSEMLKLGRPNLVVAFPGGRGTEDMVRQAERAGVEVRRAAAAVEKGRPHAEPPADCNESLSALRELVGAPDAPPSEAHRGKTTTEGR